MQDVQDTAMLLDQRDQPIVTVLIDDDDLEVLARLRCQGGQQSGEFVGSAKGGDLLR